MRHRLRLRSETIYGAFLKWLLSESLVLRPLVKGNEDSGNEIGDFEIQNIAVKNTGDGYRKFGGGELIGYGVFRSDKTRNKVAQSLHFAKTKT